MKTTEEARSELVEMLQIAGVPVKPSYRRAEVCAALSISERHFWTLLERYEPDPSTGGPRRPDSLDSYMHRTERRVRFGEIVDFLRRNSTYHRKNALDQRQLSLF